MANPPRKRRDGVASDGSPAIGTFTPIERTPPQNIDAEEALLACCILDGGTDTLTLCLESNLSAEAFFRPSHKIIFQVLLDLFKQGDPVSEVSLVDKLRSRVAGSMPFYHSFRHSLDENTNLLDWVGGITVVTRILGRIETTAHAEYWLESVREKWLLRRLISTTTEITEKAYTCQDSLDQFIDQVEQQIFKISEDRFTQAAQKFDVAIDAASNAISRILQGHQDEGILTGYKDLDGYTFGMHPGQMIILAARPSMGKTSLGMNIAENAALPTKRGVNPAAVLVFSLEMSAQDLAMRMLCGRAKVNLKRVRDGMVSKEQQRDLARAAQELKTAPIWVDDSSGVNILELRAKARRMSQQHGIKIIVVDYLQLLSGTDSRVPREQQISEISRGLKAMAKELSVPVLVLSQLNRSSEKENRPPRISDLRESGSIEQDADVVFLLATSQKSEDNPVVPQASRERELIIAKQRNGPTGDVRLTFIPEFTRFENYSPPLHHDASV